MFVHGYWGDDVCWILWSHLVLKYNDIQFKKIFIKCVTSFLGICWNDCTSVRYDILTEVLLTTHIFWDVIPCHWVSGFWVFKKIMVSSKFFNYMPMTHHHIPEDQHLPFLHTIQLAPFINTHNPSPFNQSHLHTFCTKWKQCLKVMSVCPPMLLYKMQDQVFPLVWCLNMRSS